MTNKTGYDFDELGGNVDVVIVKYDCESLNNSTTIKSLHNNAQFNQFAKNDWCVLDPETTSPDQFVPIAQETSKEFSTKAIYFFFGDASGWMGYKFYENGEETEEYNFGPNYDDEMIEMGHDPEENRKPGTVVAVNAAGEQFLFLSINRSKSKDEIAGGEKFIDEFLRFQSAYIGWDLFPQD